MPADILIHNAKVATNSVPSFVAGGFAIVQDGKIVAAGRQ